MKKQLRVMTEKPLNAETPIESFRTWTTDNQVFFKRNQGQIMKRQVKLSARKLSIEGLVKHSMTSTFEDIRRLSKVEVANTLECSGNGETLPEGIVPIRGAAYAGEAGIQAVDISVDDGRTWKPASLIGLQETYAWRHWEYLWDARKSGEHSIMARATDSEGRRQPETASWNLLGYGNNGIREHAIVVHIE
ncbi:MAG: molybdopterin-dependent oxidoreductase [Desulfobacterales bacterium]|jgi:hypothetical protein